MLTDKSDKGVQGEEDKERERKERVYGSTRLRLATGGLGVVSSCRMFMTSRAWSSMDGTRGDSWTTRATRSQPTSLRSP